jgi:hypothetical protein
VIKKITKTKVRQLAGNRIPMPDFTPLPIKFVGIYGKIANFYPRYLF